MVRAAGLTFAYDAQGRRVRRTADGADTFYLFDGWSVLLEGPSATFNQDVVANLFGPAGLLGQLDAGGVRYAHHDALGSLVLWTDPAGEIVAAYRYEPFGAREALGSAEPPPYGFVGRFGVRDDGDAGLLLMGHRLRRVT